MTKKFLSDGFRAAFNGLRETVIFEKSFVLNGESFSHLSDRDNLLAEEVLVVLKKNNEEKK